MKMRPFRRLLPVETVLARLEAHTVPVRGRERLALPLALGRVAARSYRAPRDVPAFARASWDGYAVRSADTRSARRAHPVRLRLVGEAFAEETLGRPLGPQEAVAVATGARLPRGADGIVIYEEAGRRPGAISVSAPIAPGERVADAGDDIPRRTCVVAAGQVLDPAGLGALAATGQPSIEVFRRPRVTLIPNGNELVAPGSSLGPGQIHETNNVALGALVAAGGGEVVPVSPIRDDPTAIERAVRRATAASDLVVVTGGSSVGEHDYLPSVFPRVGRLLFHGVAVRPGKPTLAAVRGDRLLLGMPGHPTSCLSNGLWMLLPLVRRLAHLPGPGWIEHPLRLGRSIEAGSRSLSSVVPLHVEDGRGYPTFKDSSAITSLSGLHAYLLRPPGAPALARGSVVSARFLPWPIANPPPSAA